MQKKDGNYEKVLLVLMALIAIAVAGLTIMQSGSFMDKLALRKVTPKEELGEIPVEKVDLALQRLATAFDWQAPERNGKPVPLNKSVLVVLKDDELYDLFVETPVFREPMTNQWLVENKVPDYLSPNVGELDPDGDGFTNEEEFLLGTKPMDGTSKPGATHKLYLKQRITNDYIVRLNSSTKPYQVQRLKPEPRRSVFVDAGSDFGFEKGEVRFKVVSFEKKSMPDPTVGEKDVSEMVVLDTATNEEFTLIKGEDKNLAEYEAQFEFRLGEAVREFTVKKGEGFQLPGTGQTFNVVDVLETEAVIAPVDATGTPGEPLTIKMRSF